MRIAVKGFLALALCVGVVGCVHSARPGESYGGKAYEAPLAPAETALDRYVARQDPAYSWNQVAAFPGEGVTTYLLEMTSQNWRSTDELSRTLWEHYLLVSVPRELKHDKALLMIGGGSNDRPAPDKADAQLEAMALATGSVTALLRMVPNQPITIPGEEEGRYEDALIAHTWEQYLLTGDEDWPLRMPMTKAAVRAMDAIQSFCAGPVTGGKEIERFVVTGGSKRGWTTWTVAAVDDRVEAIAPIVIDMLNVLPSFEHHWRVYGFWAPAVGDYERQGLMDWTAAPEYRELMRLVEPYSYRDRLTMPKMIINATGDQFFLPDSSQFYWEGLEGPKYLRYVPNGDHGLRETDAGDTLLAFYATVLTGMAQPEYTWSFPDNETIEVVSSTPVRNALVWKAHNPSARDFRVETIGKVWTSSPAQDLGNGVYRAVVPKPAQGWSAFLIELEFEGPGGMPYKLSTPVRIVPDTLPYTYTVPEAPARGFLSQDE